MRFAIPVDSIEPVNDKLSRRELMDFDLDEVNTYGYTCIYRNVSAGKPAVKKLIYREQVF